MLYLLGSSSDVLGGRSDHLLHHLGLGNHTHLLHHLGLGLDTDLVTHLGVTGILTMYVDALFPDYLGVQLVLQTGGGQLVLEFSQRNHAVPIGVEQVEDLLGSVVGQATVDLVDQTREFIPVQ